MTLITALLLCVLPVLCTLLSITYTKRRVKVLEDIMLSLQDPDNFKILSVGDDHKHVYLSPSVCKAIEEARSKMKG